MNLTPINQGSTPGASDAVYPCGATGLVPVPLHVVGRALCVDPCPWGARDLARRCRSYYGALCLPSLHPFLRRLSHRSRDNHNFHLVLVIHLRDERVHGIMTLEDLDLFTPKRGHTTPTTWEKPPSKIMEQGPWWIPVLRRYGAKPPVLSRFAWIGQAVLNPLAWLTQ